MGDGVSDVIVNVHKGQTGFGIYFTCKQSGVYVTRVDPNSEADRAGVQVDDRLVTVQDNDCRLPVESAADNVGPGIPVAVSPANYQHILSLVRQMNYCRFSFISAGMQAFMDDS